MHMALALWTALEISWVVVNVFPHPLPCSVGITARLGLFVSLAYHRGGSLAVMLRAWLSPLWCIRQQWDWAVCFISAHIKASTHWKRLGELLSQELIEKVCAFLEGEWVVFAHRSWFVPLIFEGRCRADCFPCLTSLFSSSHRWDASLGSSCINIQGEEKKPNKWFKRKMNDEWSLSIIDTLLPRFLTSLLAEDWTLHSQLII